RLAGNAVDGTQDALGRDCGAEEQRAELLVRAALGAGLDWLNLFDHFGDDTGYRPPMPYRIRKSRSVSRPPSGSGTARVSTSSTMSSGRIGSGSRSNRLASVIDHLRQRDTGVGEPRTVNGTPEQGAESVVG